MGPLTSVYFYAPLCTVLIGLILPIMEGWAPFLAVPHVGFPILFANGLVAFCLNIAGVYLIDSAGGLVLTLAGVFKDILLVTSSVLFMGSEVSLVQAGGYSIALAGLLYFKLGTFKTA